MAALNSRGVSLVEALVSLALVGVAMAGILPAFATHARSNNRCEQRSGAITAAEIRLEALRLDDVAAMPSSGMVAETLSVGGRDYQVRTQYCLNTTYCDDTTRHLTVEIFLAGQELYDVDTVYTEVR